jgi:hypothetical protein
MHLVGVARRSPLLSEGSRTSQGRRRCGASGGNAVFQGPSAPRRSIGETADEWKEEKEKEEEEEACR